VAVVLDAEGLSTQQMQQIAVEFAYSESTFVLPPRDPSHTAWVRIFTPDREIPFAGHPNIGTAFVLAAQAAAAGTNVPDTLLFEEAAGLVPVRLIRDGGKVVGGELLAPEAFSRRAEAAADKVADCLSLKPDDIRVDAHTPQVVSVGLPFLVVELTSRDALRRCAPNPVAYKATLPLDGAVSIYAYTREVGAESDDNGDSGCDLQARMFTRRMTEDPATGSATGAVVALLATVRKAQQLTLRVRQGVDMGRPSLLLASCDISGATPVVRVGGRCVTAMTGTIELPGPLA
jgi:trans-2,3-dihydro-3-hydroxyanthranilate isomerase